VEGGFIVLPPLPPVQAECAKESLRGVYLSPPDTTHRSLSNPLRQSLKVLPPIHPHHHPDPYSPSWSYLSIQFTGFPSVFELQLRSVIDGSAKVRLGGGSNIAYHFPAIPFAALIEHALPVTLRLFAVQDGLDSWSLTILSISSLSIPGLHPPRSPIPSLIVSLRRLCVYTTGIAE